MRKTLEDKTDERSATEERKRNGEKGRKHGERGGWRKIVRISLKRDLGSWELPPKPCDAAGMRWGDRAKRSLQPDRGRDEVKERYPKQGGVVGALVGEGNVKKDA